jgi:hypothetical protein
LKQTTQNEISHDFLIEAAGKDRQQRDF